MNETAALPLADLIRQTAFEAHPFLRHAHSEKVHEFTADLLVNGEFILELKAVRSLAEEHTAQGLDHLRASRREHAMLINFGSPKIQFRKYIFRQED
jgi:GxxExxY protein